jgi:hypothetical protein
VRGPCRIDRVVGTEIGGADHAVVSCRRCRRIAVGHQTGTHKASSISCRDDVVIKIHKTYVVSEKDV